jgi:hypothetical protein
MKRIAFLFSLFAAVTGLTYAASNGVAARAACGCTDCRCPDCNGEFCTCEVCECGNCACAPGKGTESASLSTGGPSRSAAGCCAK